jgi:hypothetical protein
MRVQSEYIEHINIILIDRCKFLTPKVLSKLLKCDQSSSHQVQSLYKYVHWARIVLHQPSCLLGLPGCTWCTVLF